MTKQQEESKGVPTAAYEWRYVDWEEAHTTIRKDKPDRNSFDVELKIVNELVTRKDHEQKLKQQQEELKQLIQDKIEKLHKKNRKYQKESRDIPYPVHENIEEIKEELLEEAKQEWLQH